MFTHSATAKKTIEKMALYMQKHKDVFVNEDKEDPS